MSGDGTDKSPDWKAVARQDLEAWTSSEAPGESSGEEMTQIYFSDALGADRLPKQDETSNKQDTPEPPIS